MFSRNFFRVFHTLTMYIVHTYIYMYILTILKNSFGKIFREIILHETNGGRILFALVFRYVSNKNG